MIGDKTFSALLEDCETTRAFLELLPLTLEMSKLNGNEKFYYIDDTLPTNAENPEQINAGNLMLYGNNCLVLFFDTLPASGCHAITAPWYQVEYGDLKPKDLVIMDLEGNQVEGSLNPSSDTKTHLILYKAFPETGGIVYPHSPHAVAWAQGGRDVPSYGTTHADYFYGPIPCARNLTAQEIDEDYETNTGRVIVEEIQRRKIEPLHVPGMVCRSHGPNAYYGQAGK